MIGVLVVTHGELAAGFMNSVHLIMGEQDQFDTLGLFEGNDFGKFKDEIHNKIVELDSGDGVAVLVDLLGASPYNATAMNMSRLSEEHHDVRLITGVNLPMLIETLSTRNDQQSLSDFVKTAIASGKSGVEELAIKKEVDQS
ncbi:PTS sugar transporter subunit IIA [Lacticaseibacillus rhamnosus]|uniref:PTS sugar transporter subunit IIA n=1 Tax=Lacticaseibacillus rhamnosus TaxID=47715 RepID=UPI0008A4904C|nr:PTS sugar transporter subunit IIA [Lacticaseibacillus rhamnosus]OFN13548.1 hypothetical protein HMPREF2621_06430 [Lactobacillus sp. HMSC072E07]MDE3296957.1 PTS sugar transporter subunit IIA [Lacticaseibacillus rhamnosus]MDK7181940.1 PTS sugar transporter subunit IIA [Lacticaseibacillus rhamnosus]MDK7239399.1 PTS sugar transporter subunit IIA [Lacticaseibacillus rhamnosus]MDT8863114.1 PTS sugar transporter subunit IIA [Lacticaseibacillus rhamnosus]